MGTEVIIPLLTFYKGILKERDSGKGCVNPREEGIGEHFRTVKPGISTEDFVRAFSGDGNGVLFF